MYIKSRRLAVLLSLCLGCTTLLSCKTQSSAESSVPTDDSSVTSVNDAVPSEPVQMNGVTFSVRGGFYDEPFSLSLTAENGCEMHYTTDGSTPTASSPIYTEPLAIADRSAEPNHLSAYTNISPNCDDSVAYPPSYPVDKATVLRVVTVDANGKVSEPVTQTYFIGYDEKASFYSQMKVFSLVTDEQDLFDEERGIFVLGKTHSDWQNSADYDPETPSYAMPANYTQKGRVWEREATLQIFENGQCTAAQNVGIRMHGGASRACPQKSLNIYARSDYGAPKLQYDLFAGAVKSEADGSVITEFDSFMLRNGGNDAQFARFRDRLNQTLVADRQFLTQGMEPCILFINGEFWGQYDITERIDAEFVQAHCGVPDKNVCIIKKEQLDEGPDAAYDEWLALQEEITNADLSDAAQYEHICEQIDMQSFMDYVCAELYINNDNWGKSNMAMWKSTELDENNPYADGKWRFIMFDTDYSAGIYGTVLATDDSMEKLRSSDCFLAKLFNAAMKNEAFRAANEKTEQEIITVNFEKERVYAQIDAFAKEYHDAATATLTRFWSGWFDENTADYQFNSEVGAIQRFFAARQDAYRGIKR